MDFLINHLFFFLGVDIDLVNEFGYLVILVSLFVLLLDLVSFLSQILELGKLVRSELVHNLGEALQQS